MPHQSICSDEEHFLGGNMTSEDILKIGYDFFFNHGNYFIALMPMTFNRGRIIYAESLHNIDNAFCYETFSLGLIELIKWELSDWLEPTNWVKNPITGERRKDNIKF